MTLSLKKKKTALVLASASPRRQKLLAQCKLSCTVHPSSTDERFDANEQPGKIVHMLAERKATDVARHYAQAIIIGADTMVVHRGTIFGKPSSPSEAISMLQTLSGDTHEVYTGVALIKTDKDYTMVDKRTFYEVTRVRFGELKQSEIEQYVAGGSPMDKAGAYGIQDDWGALFVKRIEGDYYNIVGLPLHVLYNHLKSFAPELLNPSE